jgi:starvation-inducible DNA-binding protein
MIEQALLKTFCSNFVAYYKSHAAHVNVVGRNFYSDHKQLQKIYEELQAEIDVLAELLRTIKAEFPYTIMETIDGSDIPDDLYPGDALELLEQVYMDIETLIEVHLDLEEATDSREYNHIQNYAQDRVKALQKHCWMLRSTIDGRAV